MGYQTPVDVLVLHAVRVLGYASVSRISARVDCTESETTAHLLDAQAYGWVTWSSFAGSGGWSLTEAGKTHGEKQLAAELDQTRARTVVKEVHQEFLPLNHVVSAACTAWQLAEMGIGERPMTLGETIASLEGPAAALADLETRLTTHLHRFAGYRRRFAHALSTANDDARWLTGTDRDSCHRAWFELHEDLIATLGLTR